MKVKGSWRKAKGKRRSERRVQEAGERRQKWKGSKLKAQSSKKRDEAQGSDSSKPINPMSSMNSINPKNAERDKLVFGATTPRQIL
jgi:hypothetical protein